MEPEIKALEQIRAILAQPELEDIQKIVYGEREERKRIKAERKKKGDPLLYECLETLGKIERISKNPTESNGLDKMKRLMAAVDAYQERVALLTKAPDQG